MNLYEHIIIQTLCIFIYSGLTSCVKNEDLKIIDTGVYPIVPCAVGLKFYVKVNNTSFLDDFDVELVPDQCCLEDGSGVDCDVLQVVGNCLKNIPKGKSSTLNLVAPVLNPYERKGYCLAYLDSKSVYRKRNVVTMRDAIKIPFDTRLKDYNLNPLPSGIEHCKQFDEDPLNRCQPVECELFYNGKKSFYSRVKKRCVEVPACVSDDDELPNAIYDPVINTCIQEEPITKDDFDYVKGLKHTKGRIAKDIVIIKKLKDAPVHVTELEGIKTNRSNQTFFHDLKKEMQLEKFQFWNNMMCYVQKNKSGVVFLFWLVVFQCALICIIIFSFARRCACKSRKNVEKKYFNYRQDVSVTTPLIGLDTMDTETTCQFMSESSHVDKKIQCYKACQKDNAKLSLSDDILSKCLNRRNWDRKPVKSEAVDSRIHCNGSKTFDTLYLSTNKKEDQKVLFENYLVKSGKNDKRSNKSFKNLAKKDDSKQILYKKTDENGSKALMSEREIHCLTYQYKDSKSKVNNSGKPIQNSGLSEKEIRCHSYNYGVQLSDDDSIKASSHSYSKLPRTSHMQNLYTTEVNTITDAVSTGRQASAQASFTNDSIDDYLSERGMNFLTGENISKYSFSDNSIKSASSQTSKRTSKSNIMKRVLSYLKRDKNRPSSEPGSKKQEDEVNLELIHMSKATMYSSSNNGTECFKNKTAKVKDSRTSL